MGFLPREVEDVDCAEAVDGTRLMRGALDLELRGDAAMLADDVKSAADGAAT